MKKLLNEPLTYIVFYLFMMFYTFGHSWNRVPEEEVGHFAGQTYTIRNGPGTKSVFATFSSLAWPLYWSVKLQEK